MVTVVVNIPMESLKQNSARPNCPRGGGGGAIPVPHGQVLPQQQDGGDEVEAHQLRQDEDECGGVARAGGDGEEHLQQQQRVAACQRRSDAIIPAHG